MTDWTAVLDEGVEGEFTGLVAKHMLAVRECHSGLFDTGQWIHRHA